MNSRLISLIVFIVMTGLLIKQLPSIETLTQSASPEHLRSSVPDSKKIEMTKKPDVIIEDDNKPKQQASIPKTTVPIDTNVTIDDLVVPDFSSIKDVKQKKTTFFSFMNSKIIIANEKVAKERDSLQSLIQNHSINQTFSEKEKLLFSHLSKKYRVNKTALPISEKLKQLKLKINQVPASLILAQSANESAWGTSRFARKGNNYFGQWCFSKGCGLVPASRDAGASHEVAKFASVQKSVEAYIYNINVGRAYAKIRKLRAEMISLKQAVDSLQLATGLEKYSERGKEYVKEIQSMIRFNKLQAYD